MTKNKQIRWRQRFQNFKKAFEVLERTLAIEQPSKAEKGGIFQFFEVCFELSWKLLKDYIEAEGEIVKSPRETLKKAYLLKIITAGNVWLDALEDRNLSTHVYDEDQINEIIDRIKNIYSKEIQALYQYFALKIKDE